MKPPVARKLAVGHTSVRQLVFWLLVVSSFNYFQKHGDVGGRTLNSNGNYIVDHGKSWNCDFEFLWEPWSNSMEYHAQHFIRPDLGPNCLQMLSVDDTSRFVYWKTVNGLSFKQCRPK